MIFLLCIWVEVNSKTLQSELDQDDRFVLQNVAFVMFSQDVPFAVSNARVNGMGHATTERAVCAAG